MARFYALFALAASACAIATPVARDNSGLGGIIQQVECSAITGDILTALETASGFLGLIPGASAIVPILDDAISIGKDLTSQCNSQSTSSSGSALNSRDLLSGIESIIGSFECSPITQDIMGAVETGLSLISSSSNTEVQQLVSTIQQALDLFKSMSASCSSTSRRQLNVGGIIDDVVCNSVVEDIMNTINTALPVISDLGISEITSFVNGLETVEQIYQSLETSCSANSSRSLVTRDFWGTLGGILGNAECSTAVGVILGGLQTLSGLLAADTNPVVQELTSAIQTAVSLGQAATASCKA